MNPDRLVQLRHQVVELKELLAAEIEVEDVKAANELEGKAKRPPNKNTVTAIHLELCTFPMLLNIVE